MARSKGFQGICARKKATTWGTAVAGGALDGIRVLTLEPNADTEGIPDRSITGRVTMTKQYAGNRVVNPMYTSLLRYEGNGRDVAGVMGTAGVPATVDTSAKKHVYKISDAFDAIFWTLAYEYLKDVKVGEVPSFKANKVTLRGESGGSWQVEVSGIGNDWKDDSAVNTTTTIDTVTVPANNELVLFKNGVFRLNAQGGGALAAGDAKHISRFEVTVERALKSIFSTEFGDKTANPNESDFARVSGSFNFPEVKDSSPGGGVALMLEQMTLTRYKADLTLTSDNLAGAATQKFQWILYFPDLQLHLGKGNIPGPEGPEQAVTFDAQHVLTIPTGFPAGYTDAMTAENYNTDAADSLA